MVPPLLTQHTSARTCRRTHSRRCDDKARASWQGIGCRQRGVDQNRLFEVELCDLPAGGVRLHFHWGVNKPCHHELWSWWSYLGPSWDAARHDRQPHMPIGYHEDVLPFAGALSIL